MIETPVVLKTLEQKTAIVHLVVPQSSIREEMGPGIQELFSVLEVQGIKPTGPWFSHHLVRPSEIFDFNISVPVETEIAPAGRVVPGILQSRTVARTNYFGPYEGLGEAWGELFAWVAEHGYTPGPDLWECYVTGPESGDDPKMWKTEFNLPLVL